MDPQDDTLKLNTSVFLKSNSTLKIKGMHLKFLILALELFLSVSVLSLLVSFFTGLPFRHSYTYYFSTTLFPLATQTFERKYMFILCNTILVFLTGKSGLSRIITHCSHSQFQQQPLADEDFQARVTNMSTDDQDIIPQSTDSMYQDKEAGTFARTIGSPYTVPAVMEGQEDVLFETKKIKAEAEQTNAFIWPQGEFHEFLAEDSGNEADAANFQEYQQEEEVQENEKESERVFMKENEQESESIILEGDEDEHESILVGEGGGQNETESEGPGSNTEELNKKIEEFIRKMKEELRLEAQQQQIIAA